MNHQTQFLRRCSIIIQDSLAPPQLCVGGKGGGGERGRGKVTVRIKIRFKKRKKKKMFGRSADLVTIMM